MKFKFCGDGDCPLWALAALHALGSLPAPLMRALLERVLDDKPIAKITHYKASDKTLRLPLHALHDDEIMDILKDTSLASRDECARAAAVIRWVLKSSWSHSCSGAQLGKDLAVLGVPRAHAAALAEAADDHRQVYVENASSTGLIVNKLTDFAVSSTGDSDTYKLTLTSDNVIGDRNIKELAIDKNQAKTLLEELRKAHKKMEEVEQAQNN